MPKTPCTKCRYEHEPAPEGAVGLEELKPCIKRIADLALDASDLRPEYIIAASLLLLIERVDELEGRLRGAEDATARY